MVFLLVSGCSDSINTLNSSGANESSSFAKPSNTGPYMWSPDNPLMPTGNSTQDTENLQNAILDPQMNAGGTLYLGPGTFYVHSSLVRQSFDPGSLGYSSEIFNGTIQGAGKGVTIIRSVRGPGSAAFTPFMGFPGTFLFWDYDYLGVKDLTFEADPEIADIWEFPGLEPTEGLVSFINIGSGLYDFEGEIGTDIINVHFKGSLDSDGYPEIPLLFECYGGGAGIHNVKSCEFENGSFVMLDYGVLAGATINVGGSPADKLTFINTSDLSVQAVNAWNVGDCAVNISHIETSNATGFAYWAHEENSLSTLNIKSNIINMINDSWYGGIEIWVEPGLGNVNAAISRNTIHSNDAFLFGPIFMEGVQDALITNNKISGRGTAAIYLGVLEQWPGSATLIASNLQMWENTGINPWGFEAAAIWLGPNITNSLVVGGNNNINVFDEPGDGPKNNVFTGVNNMQINIGQDIRDAMQQMGEARMSMMNQRNPR